MKKNDAGKFLCLLIILFCVTACSDKSSQWEKTKEGARVFIDNDSFFGGDYSWSGDTLEMGVANGKGVLSFEDNVSSGNNFKKKVILNLGSTDEGATKVGKIDDKGHLQDFGVIKTNDNKIYIGEFDDDKLNGKGVIYENGRIRYKGEIKNNLPNGKGKLYFENGKTEYIGKFKKGHFQGKGLLYDSLGAKIYDGSFAKGRYNGYGILYDSLGNKHIHIWTKGKLDNVTASYYNQLTKYSHKLNSVQLKKCNSRLLRWERYHVWMYMGWGLFIVILFFICWELLHEEDESNRYNRTKRWNKYKIWLDWLFLGWMGCHRYILRSYAGFGYFILVTAMIIANIRELCLYLFYPSTWGMWEMGSFTHACLWVMIVCLILDFFYIPWRCYVLNHNYYRHDRNEEIITRRQPTDIMSFGLSVPEIANSSANSIKNTLSAIKRTHQQEFRGKKGFFAKVGRALSGDDPWLRFEQNRARTLQRECKKAEEAQNTYAEICENINVYLEESRHNAYRNFSLAKELIRLAVKTKKSSTELTCDVALDDSKMTIVTSVDSINEIEAGVDWGSTTQNAIDSSMNLLSLGIKGPWAIGIGIGASLLNGVFEAINKAEKACEEANEQCAEAIAQLAKVNDAIITSHANILRAAEIIIALNKANEAFWQAYISLRDEVFSKTPSFSEFLFGAKVPSYLKENEEFRLKIAHLIQVCSEYNKINKAKL